MRLTAMLLPTGSDDWSRGVADTAPASPTMVPPSADGEAQAGETPKGEKHYGDDVAQTVFIGSATSFAEWDAAEDARELQVEVTDLTRVLRGIVDNIIWDQEMDAGQKATAIQAVATDFAKRAGDAGDTGGSSHEDEDGVGRRSLGLDEMNSDELQEYRRTGERAVATKKEGGSEFRAADFADVPDTATPSTWKLRLAQGESGNFTVAQVGRAITAMQPGGFRGNRVVLGSSKEKVVGRIRSAIGKTDGTDAQKASLRERLSAVKELPNGDVSTFGVKQQPDGRFRWKTVYTNRFADLEGEIFSDAAHKEFEAWVNGPDGVMPELRAWHVEGSKMGVADAVIYDDETGFMIATGLFDPSMDKAAKALAEYPEPLGVSHGYTYPRKGLKDGVYSTYRTFEISPLPMRKAANSLTGFGLEATMDDSKKAMLSTLFGAEEAEAMSGHLKTLKAKAEADGLDFKDLAAEMAEEAPAPAAPTPPPDVPAAGPAAPAAPAGPAAPAPVADAQKDAGPSAGVATAMKQVLDPMVEAIKALDDGFKALRETTQSQATEIAGLRASDDSKVAAAMRPSRLAPNAFGDVAASSSSDSVVRKDAKEVREAVEARALTEAAASVDFYKNVLGGSQAAQQPDPVAS